MIYSSKKQTEQFEDALMKLGVLGLLEIEGQKLLRESKDWNAIPGNCQGDCPGETISKLIQRKLWVQRQRERAAQAGRIIRPLFVRVSVLFFAAFLGTGSVLMVSANARETLYRLLFSKYSRYIEIHPTPQIHESFVDLEAYRAAGARFAPTYVPEDLPLTDLSSIPDPYSILALYEKNPEGDDYVFLSFSIAEVSENSVIRLDAENAERMEPFYIGDSEGILIVKGDVTILSWYVGDTLLEVISKVSTEETIKFAEGIRNL